MDAPNNNQPNTRIVSPWDNDPGSVGSSNSDCIDCSNSILDCCRFPEDLTEWETQFINYFSCALPMMYELGIDMSNKGAFGSEDKVQAYADYSNDLLYLYVYMTLLMFQRIEDSAENSDCGGDKGNSFYYKDWSILCIEKSFQCRGFDVTGLLTAQRCNCDENDVVSTTDCDQDIPMPIPAIPQVNCPTGIYPVTGSINVPNETTLSWDYQVGAVYYDIYIGTDQNNLVLVSSNQTELTYISPDPYISRKTYYWKVIPKNSYGGPSSTCPLNNFKVII